MVVDPCSMVMSVSYAKNEFGQCSGEATYSGVPPNTDILHSCDLWESYLATRDSSLIVSGLREKQKTEPNPQNSQEKEKNIVVAVVDNGDNPIQSSKCCNLRIFFKVILPLSSTMYKLNYK